MVDVRVVGVNTNTVPAKPSGGILDRGTRDWVAQYGLTHNDDGTPKLSYTQPTNNVPPRPLQVGKPSQKVTEWDEKYGQTHNTNGSPKIQPATNPLINTAFYNTKNTAGEFGEDPPIQPAPTRLTPEQLQEIQNRANPEAVLRYPPLVRPESTTANTEDRAGDTAEESQQVGQRSQVKIPEEPLTNPLEQYANYTYGLSLHAIPINKYNSIVAGQQEYTTNDNTVLIASGGRNNSSFSRNRHFEDSDFYFENFKFTTVIGHNSQTRGSNVLELEFSILEPVSISLLERLLLVATDYDVRAWDQLPLMLQIDFFANDDHGQPVNQLSDHTKRIVIRLISCNMKVDTKGTVYNFRAVPVSQSAFMQNTASTPAIFEVLSKTVGDFFDAQGNAGEANNLLQDPRERPNQGEFGDDRKTHYRIYSYAAAMNAYQQQLEQKKKQDFADTYEFILDEEIAKSKIIFDSSKNSANSVGMNNSSNPSGGVVNVEQELVRINAGSTVLDVINQVLRNSEFFTRLIKEQPKLKSKEPITLFKVIPVITFNEEKWDTKRMQYARTIRLYIKTYDYYNTKFAEVDQSLPERWHKEYNYIYTGLNQQILDLNIEFNAMFYVSMNERANKFNKTAVQPTESTEETPVAPMNQGGQIQYVRQANKAAYAPYTTIQAGTEDPKIVKSNDFHKSVFSGSQGDMINIRLKIAGDPHMIKQDEVFFTPEDTERNQVLNRHQSLNMDVTEIFAFLNFSMPQDYDQDTGMITFGQNKKINTFSGVYRILRVVNNFERGQFTQELECIKLFGQETDKATGAKKIDKDNLREKTQTSSAVVTGSNSTNTPVSSGLTVAASRESAVSTQMSMAVNNGLDTMPESRKQRQGVSSLPGYNPNSTATRVPEAEPSQAVQTPDSRRQVASPREIPAGSDRRPPGMKRLEERTAQTNNRSLFGGGGGA